MVDRTYKVFVSATFRSVDEARKAAISGISFAHHIPISLDRFAPENASDVEVIKREIKECPIYVLILGPTYGERPTSEKGKGLNPAYTELEFDHALDEAKEILIFALPWNEVVQWREENLDPVEDRDEIANEADLKAFYSKVRSGQKFFKEWDWDRTEDIRLEVYGSLMLINNRTDPPPPKGLVQELDFEQSKFLEASRNVFVRDIIDSISGNPKLYKRTTKNEDLKMKAAEFFALRFKRHMRSDQMKGIFFESGSSVAYLANQMADYVRRHVFIGSDGRPTKRILTNNVLVYLTLWLNYRVPCGHFPWGGSDEEYGASYGPINRLEEPSPAFDGRSMDKDARDAIDLLKTSELAPTKESISLLITAASGLQIGDNHDIVETETYDLIEDTKAQVRQLFGPHVGSHKNRVFKRYLYQTEIPTVLFIDSSKIDSPIDTEHCHFTFESKDLWQEILEDRPFAICIGCYSKDLGELKTVIGNLMPGCHMDDTGTGAECAALIAWNNVFDEAFEED